MRIAVRSRVQYHPSINCHYFRPALWILATASFAPLCGCAAVARRPVPEALIDTVHVTGMPSHIRTWGDRPGDTLQKSVTDSVEQAHRAYGDNPPADGLFISSGGVNGAYAAGLLCGWTAHGTRPTFRVVSGVSGGAIIAPFAFLGSEYDGRLREIAREATTDKIYRMRWWGHWLTGDAVGDNEPVRQFLDPYFDQQVLDAIAAEHAKGRRLLVTTTNLDAKRPVIWDLGALASSGSPAARELLIRVIVASAAVPVLFPPSYIEVEGGGQRYDELHVDGAVSAQIMLFGGSITAQEMRLHPHVRAHHYVILNRKLDTDWSPVKPTISEIASHSISHLMRDQGVGDLWQTYAACQRDGLAFRLAAIPDDAKVPLTAELDVETVSQLFDRGFTLARNGYTWTSEPPGLRAANDAPAGDR